MARLGGGRLAEPPEQERRRRNTDHAGGQQCRVPVPQPQDASAHGGHDEHRHDRQRVPDREVAGDPEQVVEHRRRAVELLPARPDADVEASCEDEVAVPEGRPEKGHRADRQQRISRARAREDIDHLRGQDERPVGMRRDRQEHRQRPESPAPSTSSRHCVEAGQVRHRAGQQEQAVHPPVDPVEEEHPAGGDESGRDQCRDRACDSPRQERDDGHGRDREERREEPQPDEPAAEVHDEPGEEEVQRRPAALGLHRVKEPAERVPSDEERQRLVLVRGPGGEPQRAGRRRRPR